MKKVFICVYTANSNILKIWKPLYLKKNLRVRLVNVNADTRFSNFAIEYLWENKKVRETVFASSYGAKSIFKQKNWQKSRDTASLRAQCTLWPDVSRKLGAAKLCTITLLEAMYTCAQCTLWPDVPKNWVLPSSVQWLYWRQCTHVRNVLCD